MTLRKTLLGAAAAAGLALSAGAANASIIATLNGITNSTASAGAFDFSYTATLAANEQIVSGSYLVLYDWGTALKVGPGGTLPTSATGLMATNFTFTQQAVGPTPANTSPPDSASVLNVVATYNGPTFSDAGANGNLGTFVLTSPLGGRNPAGFQGSSAQQFNGPGGSGTGTPDGNITTTTVPAAVPEPASLAVLGGALALAGVVRRRRKA